MSLEVFHWDWVCSDDDGNGVIAFDELFEIGCVGAGRVTDEKTGCEVNDFGAIFFHHLLRNGFHIAPGASTTLAETHYLYRYVFRIAGEGPHPFRNGTKAFASSAGLITSANDDPYFFYFGPRFEARENFFLVKEGRAIAG